MNLKIKLSIFLISIFSLRASGFYYIEAIDNNSIVFREKFIVKH